MQAAVSTRCVTPVCPRLRTRAGGLTGGWLLGTADPPVPSWLPGSVGVCCGRAEPARRLRAAPLASLANGSRLVLLLGFQSLL